MAADDSSNVIVNLRNNHTLSRWLVDIACVNAWEQFQETGRIEPESLRDLIQGVLGRPVPEERDSESSQKVFLLLLMCRLTDGEDYNARYSEDNDITPLENVNDIISKLLKYLPSAILNDGQHMQEAIQYQAVLTCCRQGDFQTANLVFDRLFGKVTKSSVQVGKLEKILDSKDPCHSEIMENGYKKLLEMLKHFFEMIIRGFDDPFIIKVLKAYMKDRDIQQPPTAISTSISQGSVVKMKKGMMRAVSTELDVPMGNSGFCNGRKLERLRCCLKDNRQKTVNKVVDTCLPPESLEGGRENGTQEGINVSDNNSSPRSPRKRKMIQSLRSASRKLQYATEKLSNDLNNNGNEAGPTQSVASPSSSHEIRKFRYRKNMTRRDRHQVKELDSSEEEDIDTSQSVLGAPARQLPRVSRLRTSLQPRSPSTMSVTSTRTSTFSPGKRGKKVWEQKETEELYEAVKQHGIGNWAVIRDSLMSVRTNVQIKDKWRTMLKNRQVMFLAIKFGPIPNIDK